jgi:RNA polymerase sigma-32 factor
VNYLEDQRHDPARLVEDLDWQDNSEGRLKLALQDLDERSRDIVMRRWLADDKATLHELADEYGVSAERIRQLEKSAMKKLRAHMEA